MKKNDKIFVAGHLGMVGSSIVRKLKSKGYKNLLLKSRTDLDLLSQTNVFNFLKDEKPNFVILAAAKVGGILANNTYRTEFLYENLQIQNNLIYGSLENNINNLCFLGSSCIYPKNANTPISEDCILSGSLEYTNEPYAIAKIAGLKLCENINIQYNKNFFSLMPCNLFGPNDNYDLNNSHVIPALIKKTHFAKENKKPFVEIWGSGKPFREFLFVDDFADACIYLLEKNIKKNVFNIGSGREISIKELAYLIKDVLEYNGDIIFDNSKPDGVKSKLLNSDKIRSFGWKPKTKLRKALKITYEYFKNESRVE